MKEFRLSMGEKSFIHTLLIFVIIQFLIISVFVVLFRGSQPTHMENTKKADIIIEDLYITRASGENCLVVVSDSTQYLFAAVMNRDNYPVSKLYKSLSIGDRLSIIYVDGYSILRGKTKWVLDAQTETETYRSFELHNKAKKGLPTFIIILFPIVELIWGGIIWFYISLNTNTIKGIYRKTKQRKKKY